LLKLASVTLSDEDGDDVEFVIKRVLDVREPSKANAPGGFPGSFPGTSNGGFSPQTYTQVVDVFKLQSDLETQREDISRIDSNGFKIVSALDNRVVGIERELKKLTDTLGDARRDIGVTQEDVKSVKAETVEVKRLVEDRPPTTGLEDRLDFVTTTLGEVRQEVRDLAGQYDSELAELKRELRNNKQETENLKLQIKGSVSSRRHAKDMATVLAELAQLRQQMDDLSSRRPPEQNNAPFPSRELEILTSSIAKIGSRASHVETLQMEFEIMKGRVERVEATASRQNSIPDTRQPTQTANAPDTPPVRRFKRNSSVIEATAGQNPPAKRPATSSSYLKTPARSHRTSPEPQDSPPVIKLTKSGNIDKRSLRGRKSLDKATM